MQLQVTLGADGKLVTESGLIFSVREARSVLAWGKCRHFPPKAGPVVQRVPEPAATISAQGREVLAALVGRRRSALPANHRSKVAAAEGTAVGRLAG